ncbi:MAG: excinuclease ABC subunit UvrC [Oscillospiraceae bacterium]|nr:excinuclease ABC subunit UvrC [Oscillospiraceae bacterium]
MDITALREKANALPMKPGVYIMRDKDNAVIYVGKSKLLKNRVSSYFHGAHNAKTEAMVAKVCDFSIIVATSEMEALLLENSLIKFHKPHYNILLKDDKGYPFIRLDLKSEYPRFSVTNRRENDGAEYFGPFGSRGSTFAAIDAMRKALKLPDCSRVFPRDIGKERPCLNYHMGTCDGYCLPSVPQAQYRREIDKAVMILKGKTRDLVDSMEKDMLEAAENLRFEEAAELRDRINAIRNLEEKQHVLMKGASDTDAVGFYRGEAKSCFVVLHYVRGQLLGKDMELLDEPVEDTAEALSSLVRQYYMTSVEIPGEIVLTEDTGDMDEIAGFLTEKAGRNTTVLLPQRGVRRDYREAALRNAEEEVRRATTKAERISKTAQWLMDSLGLDSPPSRIESFDISNTGADDIVAGMVVFKDGKPLKNAYRKFKIKTLENGTPDDYASMREVVERRLQHYKDGDEKFSPLPDLFLIDGGAAHAQCALDAQKKVGVFVPTFGMVKDDRHRTRALITAAGEEISMEAFPAVFAFVGAIQEEVHRYAITFHRLSHRKTVKKSKLDAIANVGEKRKNDLYKYFGSMKAMSEASVDELMRVVPRNAAVEVYKYFHSENNAKVEDENS